MHERISVLNYLGNLRNKVVILLLLARSQFSIVNLIAKEQSLCSQAARGREPLPGWRQSLCAEGMHLLGRHTSEHRLNIPVTVPVSIMSWINRSTVLSVAVSNPVLRCNIYQWRFMSQNSGCWWRKLTRTVIAIAIITSVKALPTNQTCGCQLVHAIAISSRLTINAVLKFADSVTVAFDRFSYMVVASPSGNQLQAWALSANHSPLPQRQCLRLLAPSSAITYRFSARRRKDRSQRRTRTIVLARRRDLPRWSIRHA